MKLFKGKLHYKIVAGLLAGLTAGILCNMFLPDNENVKWTIDNITNPLGQIFLRLLFMIIVPLIFTAITLGVADFRDFKKIKRIGIKILFFTFFITAISVVIGMGLVNVFNPGKGFDEKDKELLISSQQNNQKITQYIVTANETKTFSQTVVEIIPKNPFYDLTFFLEKDYRGGGLLSLMFLALIFGTAIILIDEKKTTPVVSLLQSIYEVIMKLIDMVMKLAPYAVAALIFSTSALFGFKIIAMLSKYMLIVIAALAIHFFVTYGLIIKYLIKKDPKHFFSNINEIIITAFSTSSSNATLPTSIRVSNEKLKINKDISNLVLTVGSTANQNGTALYEGVTVLFLAQFYGIDLSLGSQIVVVLLSIIAGIGTAGVPGGSLPLIVMVLQTVGVPAEGIGIILGVDRLLDMSRTVVNVSGDVVLAAWIDKSERKREEAQLAAAS